MLERVIDTLAEKVQGLGFAFTILVALLGLAAVREQPKDETFITLATWVITIILFWVGRYWDDLWDKVFGPKKRWGALLDKERLGASKRFETLGWTTSELQKTSTSLFKHSLKWEENIRYPLEFSKAARTFILPLLILLIYELAGGSLGRIRESVISRPLVTGLLLLVAVVLYVWLRIRHNRNLYRLVVKAEEPVHGFELRGKWVLIESVPEVEGKTAWSTSFIAPGPLSKGKRQKAARSSKR